jgi:hypothetical protein
VIPQATESRDIDRDIHRRVQGNRVRASLGLPILVYFPQRGCALYVHVGCKLHLGMSAEMERVVLIA